MRPDRLAVVTAHLHNPKAKLLPVGEAEHGPNQQRDEAARNPAPNIPGEPLRARNRSHSNHCQPWRYLPDKADVSSCQHLPRAPLQRGTPIPSPHVQTGADGVYVPLQKAPGPPAAPPVLLQPHCWQVELSASLHRFPPGFQLKSQHPHLPGHGFLTADPMNIRPTSPSRGFSFQCTLRKLLDITRPSRV